MTPTDIDIFILTLFNKPFLNYLNVLFIFIIYSIYGYLILLLYIYFKNNEKRKVIHIIFSVIIGILVVNALKYSINRPRPYEFYPEINKILVRSDPAFPSAHVFISFFCFYFLPKKQNLNLFRKLSIIYLLILIPIGSMYIGVHYPSDILGGAILGLIIPRIISEKMTNKLVEKIF